MIKRLATFIACVCAQTNSAAELPQCLNPALQARLHNGTMFSIAVDSSLPEEGSRCSVASEDRTGEKSLADCTRKWVSGCVLWYRNSDLTDQARAIMNEKGWKLPSEETITLSDGTKYIGELQKGSPEGVGTLYLPNGDKYSGGMRSGQPSGSGEIVYSDGRILRCDEWSQGLPSGRCTLQFTNGLEAAGDWKQGVAESPMQVTYPNGYYYGNMSSSGLRDGCGIMNSKSIRTKGYWHEDKLVNTFHVDDDDFTFSACLYGREIAYKRAADREEARQINDAWFQEWQKHREDQRMRDTETTNLLLQAIASFASGYANVRAIRKGQTNYHAIAGVNSSEIGQRDALASGNTIVTTCDGYPLQTIGSTQAGYTCRCVYGGPQNQIGWWAVQPGRAGSAVSCGPPIAAAATQQQRTPPPQIVGSTSQSGPFANAQPSNNSYCPNGWQHVELSNESWCRLPTNMDDCADVEKTKLSDDRMVLGTFTPGEFRYSLVNKCTKPISVAYCWRGTNACDGYRDTCENAPLQSTNESNIAPGEHRQLCAGDSQRQSPGISFRACPDPYFEGFEYQNGRVKAGCLEPGQAGAAAR